MLEVLFDLIWLRVPVLYGVPSRNYPSDGLYEALIMFEGVRPKSVDRRRNHVVQNGNGNDQGGTLHTI